ncbi:acyl-CoA dehydrogenase family protein [soil metagenome]
MAFTPVTLSPELEELRRQVRAFLAEEMASDDVQTGLGMMAGHSPQFSKKLAKRGWVGMAIPTQYSGGGATVLERFVVVEELLAAGAPLTAHWISERQTAPSLLNFGTEEQRERFLPAIARGECYFYLGMSEPDSGSDLASVRSRADKVDGGWNLNGTKVWTSGAHLNHYFAVLCRTSEGETRHQGLSQLIVDLSSDGVNVNPIKLLDGNADFNEVVLEDVFVPDDMLLGEEGTGWQQVTAELAHERSAPDRFLSTFPVLEHFLREHDDWVDSERAIHAVGRLVSHYHVLRQMSLSIAASLQAGDAPAVEASMLKDIGTLFEQELIEVVRSLVDIQPRRGSSSDFERLLGEAILTAPGFTLRGGTNEILRTVVARELMK